MQAIHLYLIRLCLEIRKTEDAMHANCDYLKQTGVFALSCKNTKTFFITSYAIIKQKNGKKIDVHSHILWKPIKMTFQKLTLVALLGFPKSRKQSNHSAFGIGPFGVSWCFETLMRHSNSFMKYYKTFCIGSL